MKVLTKNYGLDNGERKYLTYLMDDNNNALECFDTFIRKHNDPETICSHAKVKICKT